MKKLLAHPVMRILLGHIGACYLRLVWLSSRKIVQGTAPITAPHIIALWHNQLLLLPWLCPNQPAHVLISQSRDGQQIAAVAKALGLGVVAGSSNKGGAQAVRTVINKLKQQHNLFITPDGPRGPVHTVSKGTIDLARLSKTPLIPVAIATKKHWTIKSWDKFQIPKPFNTITVHWGSAIDIDKTMDLEQQQQNLQQQLQNLTQAAAKETTAC